MGRLLTTMLRSVDTLIYSLIVGLEWEILSHGHHIHRISLIWISFFWGHLKSLVYESPVDTDEELFGRVLAASLVVQQTPGIFERVRQNFLHWCHACVETGDATLNSCCDL